MEALIIGCKNHMFTWGLHALDYANIVILLCNKPVTDKTISNKLDLPILQVFFFP